MKQETLRRIPSIDDLMNSEDVARLTEEHGRSIVLNAARAVIQEIRQEILSGEIAPGDEDRLSIDGISSRISLYLRDKFTPSMRSAINATGVILHTGLGRAVFPESAVNAVDDVIHGYCTLAADIETGQRSSRDVHISDLLCELTGAEAATITNNNAAATLLVLNTLASGREVIVSRGQLIEIGGSFRLPEVMAASGAILREVGTTNKTHLSDYKGAINENTGAILKVHHSNYRIVGFTEEPSIWDMARIAKEHNLPIIDDVGSGALVDLTEFGLSREPMVQDSIAAGADVVCFSGDKLVGGPQSGVIVGKAEAVRRIKKNPLARALRVGKTEVAALEATLRLFLNPEKLMIRHPLYRMLSIGMSELEERARAVVRELGNEVADQAEIGVMEDRTEIGSGSSPAETIPTMVLSVKPFQISASALARRLRRNSPPIFARIHDESILFDVRTILPGEERLVADALVRILSDRDEHA